MDSSDFDTSALEELITVLFTSLIGAMIDILGEFFWALFDMTWISDNMPYLIVLSILAGGYIVMRQMAGGRA
ncbi:MAG: hypothetical protein ACFFDT_08035 [Candidatus Hodarchaeota archaeon]